MDYLWIALASLGALFLASVIVALVETLRQGQRLPPPSAPPALASLDVNLLALDGEPAAAKAAPAPREAMAATLERAARPASDTAWTETTPMVLPSRNDVTTP